ASGIAEQLLSYTGLTAFMDKAGSIAGALPDVIKPNLNCAVYSDYKIQNRYVSKLYEQLQQCKGGRFDRKALMDVVMECRRAISEFSGWSELAQELHKQAARPAGNTSSLIMVKDYSDKNEHLRITLSVRDKELKKAQMTLKKEQQKIFTLKISTSYQVGQVFVKAVTKPGKNTLFFPFYLFRILLASRAVKS
ncbi:MAG: hypothetical protein GY705_03785, partial [Bacteroidetes bacterium]|nr:hypothetical protein [Bacteroidota bacterium]